MNVQTSQATTAGGLAPPPEPGRVRVVGKPFLTTMGVVAALAAIYYAVIATPMYVSEAQFTIRGQPVAVAAAGPLGGGAGAAAGLAVLADISAVQEHIHSQEMLREIDKQFHLRDQYSRFRIDPLRFLSPKASEEAFLRFYRRMVVVKLDRQVGLVEVDVRSFDKTSAPLIAEAILQRTEAFVDGMSQRARTSTMQSAESELARAQQMAAAARQAVGNFRGANSSVDPAASGAQVLGGQGQMEAAAAVAQAELASALTFNRPDAPVVKQLRARLAAVQAEAARRRAEQGVGGQARQVTSYEALIAQRQIAEQRLAAATSVYEAARASAQQREKYVVRVVNPSLPDRPSEPRRVIDFFTVMVFALAGYAIVSLAIASIRDHRGV